jgi:N-acetyl-anhydromuramyl-L-alanine amidase AmpD
MQRIKSPLPEDSSARKEVPLVRGLLDYFPAALAAVAHHSYISNEKHNPGQDMHWSRGKSADHEDALLRHVMERDLEGAAWRALAALQMQLEEEGAPKAPAAR